MQETKSQIINHIRIMIEEVEHPNEKVKASCEICALYSAWWFQQKLFVLLLHFPAMMFYDPCYPSLFLCGWDYYYIDAVEQASNSSLVNTKYVTNRAVAMHLSCMYIQTVYLHVCIMLLICTLFIGNGLNNLVYLHDKSLHLMTPCSSHC